LRTPKHNPIVREQEIPMRQYTLAVALICFGLGLHPAHAQDPKVDCANQTNDYEMRICASADLDAADKELNAAYKLALATIKARDDAPPPYDNKAYEAALRTAQRAWVTFRDAECNVVVPFEWTGGTGGNLAVLGCLQSLTIARTKNLTDLFTQRE
jgi:uncharacterized protein YecT (DUF1311 family)